MRDAPASAGGEASVGLDDSVEILARRRLICRGTVQGVGFRPAVHRLAASLRLAGWVRNGPDGAEIEIEGRPGPVAAFLDRFPSSLPPLARLSGVEVVSVEPAGARGFVVRDSAVAPRRGALVPPDAMLCDDCRAEMEDPADRRHRYPFTTCTNCGPRFTLAVDLPYDRERTSMACFPLCADCRREYDDPADRRFHAEPLCCPACGPLLMLLGRDGASLGEGCAAVEAARFALASGAIVAVKGLGGFHVACRADRAESVRRLRERKRRPTKPFAVMARDLAAARELAILSAGDEAMLTSPLAPILLAPARRPSPLCDEVAPGLDDLGVMLPTTPLHVEIFREGGYDTLVMTSGNAGDEPICRGNREALARLAGIADLFLVHDRDVVRRADDSVFRSAAGAPVAVRRSRGRVPSPLPLPVEAPAPILALGAHLQATACVALGREAIPSQHVGDLDNDAARGFLREAAEGLEVFLQMRAGIVAIDQHPDYASTWLGEAIAAERGARIIRVQHHLAHAAAVLGEHGAFPPEGGRAGAIVLDGTGWGPDGTAWGGEFLLIGGDLRWKRAAHLEPIPLVGGEKAVREPWRVLAAALALGGGADLLPALPVAGLVGSDRLETIARLARETGGPMATGAGRLFEAAGALLGLAAVNEYEGEAAARLESLAARATRVPRPWPEASAPRGTAGPSLSGPALLAVAARRLLGGEDPSSVAAGFHSTFCALAVATARLAFPREVRTVALGGGCLVNRLLRRLLSEGLAEAGLTPLLPREVPPGDGGISYGQALVAALAAARGAPPALEGAE